MKTVLLPESIRHAKQTTVMGETYEVVDGAIEVEDEVAEEIRGNTDLHAHGWRIGERESDETDEDPDDAYNASPAAVLLARELGVDLGTVQGSGKDGLIVKSDVQKAADA